MALPSTRTSSGLPEKTPARRRWERPLAQTWLGGLWTIAALYLGQSKNCRNVWRAFSFHFYYILFFLLFFLYFFEAEMAPWVSWKVDPITQGYIPGIITISLSISHLHYFPRRISLSCAPRLRGKTSRTLVVTSCVVLSISPLTFAVLFCVSVGCFLFLIPR